jgi:uncharacterized protein YjbI with pentapeptide repeats
MTLSEEILQAWKFALVPVLLILGTAAQADCADPPGPEVDWRRCTMHTRSFVDANLSKARLKDGRFTRADFSGANLEDTDLRRAKFIDARLVGSQLNRARLQGADLTKADLTGASLRDADLSRAQFQGAILRRVDLTGALLRDTNMLDADLSEATWVDGKTVCAEGSISSCLQKPSLKTNGDGSG